MTGGQSYPGGLSALQAHRELAIRGALRDHSAAAALAAEVQRVHRRYAVEVVAAFGLCPFLRDPDTAFGRFFVMLDRDLDVAAACAAFREAGSPVVHIVYPCADPTPTAFERFAGALHDALRRSTDRPPVMAAFHPRMAGDRGSPHRLIGVLRRAPDPFVQLIPDGFNEGGTTFAVPTDFDAGAVAPPSLPAVDRAAATFARLAGTPEGDRVVALLEEIRADRHRSYAPLLRRLGVEVSHA